MTKTIIIPSSPADLKKLKDAMTEGSGCYIRMDSEKEALKDIIETVAKDLELPKGVVAALIRHYHKSDFDKKETEFQDFSELWDAVQKV